MNKGEKEGILDVIELELELFRELAAQKPIVSTEFVVKQLEIIKKVVEK